MGTNSEKLNWLLTRKGELVTDLNIKEENIGNTPSFSSESDLSLINAKYDTYTRRRLVPVMTMYMPYAYGTNSGVTGYYPLKYYNTAYTWVDQIIDPAHCVIDNLDYYFLGTQAPNLSRQSEGIAVGTLPAPFITAVHNQPFVFALGIWSDVTNQTTWKSKPFNATMSYYYPSNRDIKVGMADDHTPNDGIFVLGNIAMVDPLLYPAVREYALTLIGSYHVNTVYSSSMYQPGSIFLPYAGWSFTESNGAFTITIDVGYNSFSYIWPVITTQVDTTGKPLMYAVKKITVNPTTTVIEVRTGYKFDMSKSTDLTIMLFGKRF